MLRLRADSLFIAAALVWLGVLAFVPGWQASAAAFGGTLAVVLANAATTLWMLTRTRRLLVALSAVQIALFGMLSAQLASAFGPEHYHFDHPPRAWDWIEFTLAHVVRAADLLDALEEYGVRVQTISHRSIPAALILAGMHLTVDGFLLDLLVRWARRRWSEPPRETRLERERRAFAWTLASAALFLLFGIGLGFSARDWILWPLDQLLRLIDVGDLMHLFRWRLHSVETSHLAMTAGLVFRAAAGICMARLVIRWRLTVFRTWGLSIDELIHLLDDPDAPIRKGACAGLATSGEDARPAVVALCGALDDLDRAVRLEAARTLGAIGPAALEATPRLTELAWLSDEELRVIAIDALGQIGPAARSSLHSLLFLLKVGDDDLRRSVYRALKRIAPEVIDQISIDLDDQPRSPPSKSRIAWTRCLTAARLRESQEAAVHAQLVMLLAVGFFREERSVSVIVAMLAEAESTHIVIPLLALISEGKLRRRRDAKGDWVYGEPRSRNESAPKSP